LKIGNNISHSLTKDLRRNMRNKIRSSTIIPKISQNNIFNPRKDKPIESSSKGSSEGRYKLVQKR